MKKGLRLFAPQLCFRLKRRKNHRPDEEGIETCSCVLLSCGICSRKNHRPDEEGIETDALHVERRTTVSFERITDLMKKGLRQFIDPHIEGKIDHGRKNHRPDEEGIETFQSVLPVPECRRKNHRPDEEGIETAWVWSPRFLKKTVRKNHRPDEEGIET